MSFFRYVNFKWAFNAKPDIVIHTSSDEAVCIECKFESGEGTYPSHKDEIKEFRERKLPVVSQTELQKQILEEMLGIKTQFIFLVQKENKSFTHKSILWSEVFQVLNLEGHPHFILEWIKRL